MKNIIVVDGASSGMGREFAKLIVKKEKADEIWVIARRKDRLEELKNEIEIPVIPLVIDLAEKKQIDDVYKARLEAEKPNILVLGLAAGFGRFSHYENVSLETDLQMVDVNLKSTIIMVNYSLPYMKEHSNIMIIASDSSIQPVPYQNMYATTKAAVLSYGRSLNRELKYRGIHVLSVTPLWVDTEFFSHAIDPNANKVVVNYGKIDSAKEVMQLAVKDLYTKKDVSIYGAHNRFQHFMVKLLPHKWIMSIWLKQQKLDGTPECRK